MARGPAARCPRPIRAVRPAMERVVDALVDELRRRLGGPFTSDELARLYVEQGTDWAFDIATRVAPRTPEAWDMTTVGRRRVRALSARGRRLRRRPAQG